MQRALLLLAAGLGAISASAEEPRRPDILFIIADDQAYDTIRALGNKEIETPNLDRLVERGTTFTHAYNMGAWASAVCVPSRTMLISGQSLWNAGVHSSASGYSSSEGKKGGKKMERPPASRLPRILETYQPKIVTDFRPWPLLLREAGYSTFFAGKWHISLKTAMFDHCGTVRGGMPAESEGQYNRPHGEGEYPWKPWDKKKGGYWQGGTHWSEVLANEAIQYLKSRKYGKKPFFMYVAFNAPHDPRQSPEEFVEKYPTEKLSVPQPFLPEYPFVNEIIGRNLRGERLAPYPRSKEAILLHRQEYYAIITHMDQQIGRILEASQESGRSDNTMIVFTSDHGLACGRHGLMAKQSMFEHSIRCPLVFCGPGIPKGRKIDDRVYYQSVGPTFLEAAGVKIPEFVDFHSLLPLIHGQGEKGPYASIYAAYFDTQRAVIHDNFKLIIYPYASQQVFLYDLTKDPEEIEDLAARPEYHELIRKLAARLQEIQTEMNDPLDISGLLNAI